MTYAKNTSNRIYDILRRDKLENPTRFAEILKSELLFVIQSYMEIDKQDLNVRVNVNERGELNLLVEGRAKRVFKTM